MAGPRFEDLLKAGGKLEGPDSPAAPTQAPRFDELVEQGGKVRTLGDEEREKEQRASEDPGFFANAGHQLLRGYFKGGSDEGAAALTTALRTEKDDEGRPTRARDADVYRLVRDKERATLAAGDKHRPKQSFLFNVAGDVASDLTAAAFGVPVLSPTYQTLMGGLRGLGESTAELTPDKVTPESRTEAAVDVMVGGTAGNLASKLPGAPAAAREALRKAGAAVEKTAPGRLIANSELAKAFRSGADNLGGAIASGAQRLAKPVGEAIESVARWPGEMLDRAGIATGRRVLTAGQGSLSGKAALTDDQVRSAMDAGAILPFGTVRGASERLTKVRNSLGDLYESIVTELEERGVQGPEAKALADRWMERYREEWSKGSASKAVAKEFGKQARNVEGLTRPPPGMEGPPAQRLRLSQTEGLKRNLQNDARYGDFKETPVNEARREIASDVRQAAEDEVRRAAATTTDPALKELAERFEPVKRRLANIIPAEDAAFRGAEQASKANALSLRDTMLATAGLAGAGGAAAGVKGAMAAVPLAIGSRLARTRGPSTFAWGSRAAARLYLDTLDSAPWLLGDVGAVVARESTPEARLAMTQALADAYPAVAEALEDFKQRFASRPTASGHEARRD